MIYEFQKVPYPNYNPKKQNKETSELEAKIDQMVYDLYGLSDEEIAVVEGRDVLGDSKIGYNNHSEEIV